MTKVSGRMKLFFIDDNIHTLRLIVTIACLILFVLAAGAPSGMGGIGMQTLDRVNPTGQMVRISANALPHISPVGLEQISIP